MVTVTAEPYEYRVTLQFPSLSCRFSHYHSPLDRSGEFVKNIVCEVIIIVCDSKWGP